MAKKVIARLEKNPLDLKQVISFYSNHDKYIEHDEWASLPEITNHNGERCPFSCFAQAWSIAVPLESLFHEG